MFKRLKSEMLMADITVSQLAEKIGVAEKTLRNKINGAYDFTWPEVLKIRKIVAPNLLLEDLFKRNSEAA